MNTLANSLRDVIRDTAAPVVPYRCSQNVAYSCLLLPPARRAVERIIAKRTMYVANRSLQSNWDIFKFRPTLGGSCIVAEPPLSHSVPRFFVDGPLNIAKLYVLNYWTRHDRALMSVQWLRVFCRWDLCVVACLTEHYIYNFNTDTLHCIESETVPSI